MRDIEKSTTQKNVFNLGQDYFITAIEAVKIILDELGMNEVKLEFAGGKRGWLATARSCISTLKKLSSSAGSRKHPSRRVSAARCAFLSRTCSYCNAPKTS